MALDPGWCKLDWVVADPSHGTLANASNMLDVTWEAPDGSITPLDGYLDGYFQEVYLEADSIPIFSKVVRNATPDALDDYVAQLEHEVAKYVTQELNYGKAAKRMYNVFRLTGRYMDAVYLRELFDEPAALLYQVWSLVRTIDDAVNPDEPTTMREAVTQADALITEVASVLDGAEETEIVRTLVRLREQLDTGRPRGRPEHRCGGGAQPPQEPGQHLLPRPAGGGPDDQRLHRPAPGGVRRGRRRVALIRPARRPAARPACVAPARSG